MSEKNMIETAFERGVAAGPERWIEGVPYLVNPLTGKPEGLEHLLLEPVRVNTHRTFQTTAGFVAYVARFKEPESSLYLKGQVVIAEIDHANEKTGVLALGGHTAQIAYEHTTAMKGWIQNNGKHLSQQEFADLLEERAVDIVHPDSAEMIEIAQALHITKNSAVTSVTRQGVNHHITFSDEQKVKAGNDADIPSRFELRLRPFLGSDVTIELAARLRVSMSSGKPTFVYELQDYKERLLETLRVQVAAIADAVGLPGYI